MKQRVISLGLLIAMLFVMLSPVSALAAELPEESSQAETMATVTETPEPSRTEETEETVDTEEPTEEPRLQSDETETPELPAEKQPQTITGVESAYKVTYGDAAFKLKPETSGDGSFTFTSDNTAVVKVGKTSGKMTFLSAGTANVTVTAGETGTFEKAVFTTMVTVSKAKQTLSGLPDGFRQVYEPGSTFRLEAVTSGDGVITYKSSDTAVIKVGKTSGKVAVVGAGEASITVTAGKTVNYKKATRTVSVTIDKAKQTISGIADSYEKNYKSTKSFKLKGTTTGDGALTYKSSDTDIATVGKTSGKVTLKKRGTCTITVTAPATGNYKKATFKTTLTLYKRAKNLKASGYYKKSKYYKRLKALKLTGTNRENVLEIAKSQLGYHEGNSASQMGGGNKSGTGNITEYGNYYGIQGAWCAMFVNWCARENNTSTKVIPSTCRVMDYYAFFHKKGQRYYKWSKTRGGKGSYKPKAGDLILYSVYRTGETHHIGYVKSCTVKKKKIVIKTLEGNASDEARERTWTLNRGSSGYVSSFGQYINGFASPKY